MTQCRGCNSRLKRAVGNSGFCDPCFIVVRLEKLVFTRCPPCSADQLFNYSRKVSDTIESTCEKFEADRTAVALTKTVQRSLRKEKKSARVNRGQIPLSRERIEVDVTHKLVQRSYR